MKKILALALSFCTFAAFAHTAHITVDNITSSSGYYCMEVYVGYDKEKGCGIPTRLGTNFINQYLHGITGSKEYFIKFGYSKAQPNNYWPAEKYTCQFPLDGTANLTVNIKNNQQCTITNQL